MQWLPSLALVLSTAISFFTAESAIYLPTLIFGTYISWIYLRYWQKKPETKLRGDPSDEFAFSTFFPEPLRWFSVLLNLTSFQLPLHAKIPQFLLTRSLFWLKCRPVIDPIASIFDRMLCRRSATVDEDSGYILGGSSLPGSDPIEASRRR